MITLSKSGNSVTFTFDENSGYLQNGTIDVPINSLALIIDESDMATFRKSASNDIFISARYEEFGMSKAELEAWYKANMVGSSGGGGGVTPQEVEEMIDEAVSGKAESVSAVSSAEYVSSSTTINFKNVDGDVISSIDASDFVVDGMIDDVRIETISGVSYLVIDFNTASGKEDIQIPLTDIFDPSNYYNKTEIDNIVSGLNESIDTKLDASAYTPTDLSEYWTSAQTTSAIDAATSGKADTTAVTEAINEAVSGKVDTSAFTAYSGAVDSRIAEDEEVTAAALNELNEALSSKQDTLSAGTGISIVDNVISATGGGGGGNPTVELTQAQYDALISAGTVSADTYYIITDAPAVDISNYWTSAQTSSAIDAATSGKVDTSAFTAYSASTDSRLAEDEEVTAAALNVLNTNKLDASAYTPTDLSEYWTSAQTDSAITSAVSTKQDTLVSGTNIKTINNTSILGSGNIDIQGGGKAVSGGTNISITTGETADTINCTLNAKNGTGAGSIIFGNANNISSTQFSVSFGSGTKATGLASIAEGELTQTTAWYSHSSGKQTLASGSYSHAEGDHTTASTESSHSEGIYTLVSNKGEHSQGWYNVSNKTSDTFGDSGNTLFSVGNGTSNNARHNAFEIRQNGDIYCSDGTNDVKLQDYLTFKMVAISQSDYDTLVSGGTVDSSTLYIITNVVN